MIQSSGTIRGQLDAAIGALRVDRDTVLQVRAALLVEAARLLHSITLQGSRWGPPVSPELRSAAGSSPLIVEHCGGDPVSADASAAFTERVSRLIDSCLSYIGELVAAGDRLADTARTYGYTEEDIVNSMACG